LKEIQRGRSIPGEPFSERHGFERTQEIHLLGRDHAGALGQLVYGSSGQQPLGLPASEGFDVTLVRLPLVVALAQPLLSELLTPR